MDFANTPRFLIDASVFGGSSGSPVFILNNGSYMRKNGDILMGASRFHFVGVVAQAFFRTQVNEIIPQPIPTQASTRSQEMLDLGIVFKARTVIETIDAFFEDRVSVTQK